MKSETLSVLICPVCRDRLQVTVVKAVTRSDRLRDGIIQCLGCRLLFPVLNWVPRLLPNHALTVDELRALEAMSQQSNTAQCIVEEERLVTAELQERLKERIRTKLNPSDLPDKLRERQEQDVGYRLHHTEEKGKFIRTAQAYLDYTPSRILDVGGSQGGALTAFDKHFKPKMAVLLDIDPEWVEVARLREPDTEVIRADAARMPLADGCMDFVFSSATLEHIEDWKSAVHEMVRVGNQGLLCYNPNAGFPYDFGHLDTPLVTWLPRSIALTVAYFFHRLRRTGRTLDSIRVELAGTFYIHRKAVVRELTHCGVEVDNAFGEFMKHTVQESYHIRGGRILSFFQRHPNLLAVFTKALVLIGAEPNVYLFYRHQKPDQIREHYEIEKQLAHRLRNSTSEERQTLYTSLYDELFSSLPHHPQLTIKSSPEESARKVAYEIRHLQPFLKRDTTFLEIGPGDCALSFEVSRFVKTVYAIDVSEEITKNLSHPPNFKLILSDGANIPLPAGSVDIAYSNQLMEHLHPDDALKQLHNIYDALAPGGIYMCLTPNRLNGPHDVSRYFDTVATGFHLKEYTVTELYHLFKTSGFSKMRIFIPLKSIRVFIPVFPVMLCEKILSVFPYSLRNSIASSWPVAKLLGICLVGIK